MSNSLPDGPSVKLFTRHNRFWRKLVHKSDTACPGLGRTYRRTRDRYYYARQRPTPTDFGFELAGEYNSVTMRSGEGEVGVFQRYASSVDVVIDIGANIGLYTCVAAMLGKRVVAVEPHPDNVHLLLMNLFGNGLEAMVEVVPVALDASIGILPLLGGRQGATLIDDWGGKGGYNSAGANYRTLVPVTTLDNIIGSDRFAGCRLFVKIDVEGNEYGVLLGAQQTLARTPAPIWMLEHGLRENFGQNGSNPHFAGLFELFWRNGYSAYTVEEVERIVTSDDVFRWIEHNERDFGGINFLFRKN